MATGFLFISFLFKNKAMAGVHLAEQSPHRKGLFVILVEAPGTGQGRYFHCSVRHRTGDFFPATEIRQDKELKGVQTGKGGRRIVPVFRQSEHTRTSPSLFIKLIN